MAVKPSLMPLRINNELPVTIIKLFKGLQSNSDLDGKGFRQLLMDTGKTLGIKGKDLFFPVRLVLYGNTKGPDIQLIFSILGRTETLQRLSKHL